MSQAPKRGFKYYNNASRPLLAGIDIARVLMGFPMDYVQASFDRYHDMLNNSMDAEFFCMTFDQFQFVFHLITLEQLNFSTAGVQKSAHLQEHDPRTKHFTKSRFDRRSGSFFRSPDGDDTDVFFALFQQMEKPNHKLDIFELFSVMAVLCRGSLLAKVSFLFTLFDFDDEERIVEDELSFMIMSLTEGLSKLQLCAPPKEQEVEYVVAQAYLDSSGFTKDCIEKPVLMEWMCSNPFDH